MKKVSGKTRRRAALLVLLCLLLAGTVALRRAWTDLPAAQSEPAQPAAETPAALVPTPAPVTPTATPAPSAPETPVPTLFRTPKGYTRETYDLVSDMVYAYASLEGEAGATVAADLERLRTLDAALAELWEKLMALWAGVNTALSVEPYVLPDGLPEDESLCIVVLGFQLEADGSMSPELVGRCETALACAQKYPRALIAVTGGGTAWQAPEATEAGVMAEWLTAHGVEAERILTEDASRTTVENALFTCALLRQQQPQVSSLAIVTSDYHLPLGILLFQAEALQTEYETGVLPFSVAANAAYVTDGLVSPDTPMMQKNWLWSLLDPKY